MLIRPLIRYVVVVAATALAAYQASAENFTLQSGDIVEGRIIRALGGTLSIKMPARGMMQVPINAVDRVEIELDSGETIVGRFIGWSRGVYQIDVDGRLLDIAEADGAFTIVAEATTIAAEATPEEDDSDGVGGPRVVLAQEAGEAVEPASEDVLAQAETAALEPGLRVVSGSSLPADEGEGEAIFTLSLSAPDSKPIVVLYSALEQEAKGGVDYRVSAGVAIFEAGEVSINISVPVIDDDLGEPNEAFKLFLTVDPDMAALKDREIVTVILDND